MYGHRTTRGLRWRFPHSSEARAREEILARIDAFWRLFAEKAERLASQVLGRHEEVAAFMQEHLSPIDPGIAWELGPEPEGGGAHHALALTPEVRRHLVPLVDVVLARAPRLPGWEFHAHRQPRPIEMVRATVKGRVGVELTEKWSARAWQGKLGGVQLLVSPPGGLFRSTAKDQEVALVALEALLGEELLYGWVDGLELARRGGTSPLEELPASVASLVAAVREQLPVEPWVKRSPLPAGQEGKVEMPFSVMQLQPKPADDYPAQADLAVGSALSRELWNAQHHGHFVDQRFSRAGETFCYLKVDGRELEEERERAEYEEPIIDALAEAGLGCVVGGGTGLFYSYTELALSDVIAAMEVMRPILRAQKLPLRSWLLFWDARLADEWLPVWDDTPPPPR
jgi:hypothetical protein